MPAPGTLIERLYRERFPVSQELFDRAARLFPSGITHDSRYLKPFPVQCNDAKASRKTTVDGVEVIDYWMGHGALLLGHSNPAVVRAVQQQVLRSTHPGASNPLEIEWGELVRELVPSAERVRFTSSGTEATLMALRVARLVTGRRKVIKFAGHFHGWHDSLIVASDPPHDGAYAVPGVTDGVLDDIVLVPPNDIAALERAIDEHQPACVIHEGNGSRWGFVPARPPFLRDVREVTQRRQTLFILDEVITGFRVGKNSYQGECGIVPDMTTLAKVLAGGLPGGCLAGRADLMQALAFDNPFGKKMKHPGTYNGNPLSAAAGIAALQQVATGEPCRRANSAAAALRAGLNRLFAARKIEWVAYGDYSAVKLLPGYSGPRPSSDLDSGRTDSFLPFDGDWRRLDCKHDASLSHAFRCALLLSGADWMGWGGSTSSEHTPEDITRTIEAFDAALTLLRDDGFAV